MSVIIAIVLFVFAFVALKMDFGSLKDGAQHENYGVQSEALHKKFSWLLIIFGACLATVGGPVLTG